ncbi:MAG: aminotransferase class IV [Fidelibacterota bacterium]|nr:MAG: aminotransferase class IV [Candidatus Neomarinimicrobiota bacterium]
MSPRRPTALQDPIVYINGEWVRLNEATVPFMDSGFWYGDGLFETLRAANGTIFRPYKHLARMREGMKVLKIDFPLPDNQVVALMEEAVELNNLRDTLLRLMCTRGTLENVPWKHQGPSNLYIGFRFADAELTLPVKVVYIKEDNYPIGRMVPALKSMTYLGNMLAIGDAVAQGAYEPVFVNRDGLVTECAIRNIFFVQGSTLRTADVSLGILPGVTRDLILELANDLGLEVDISPVRADEVNRMDEAFISSTGIGVCPCTWDGFHDSDYAITYRLREAVETLVQRETGGS